MRGFVSGRERSEIVNKGDLPVSDSSADNTLQAQPATDLRVAICVTGSLYATQVPGYVARIRRHLTDDVRVVMTPDSQRFITGEVMAQYAAGKVHLDSWDTFEDGRPSHIGLAKWADCVIALPLSGNSLAKLACGISDNLALELLIASDPARTALAPAMNLRMWHSPSVERNLATVTSDGFTVLETAGAPEVGRPAGPVDGMAPKPQAVLDWLQRQAGSHTRAQDVQD